MYKLFQRKHHIHAECVCGAVVIIPLQFTWTLSLLDRCPVCDAVSRFHDDILPAMN